MSSMIRRILMLVCVAVMCLSGWKIWQEKQEYRQGDEAYSELEDYVSWQSPQPPTAAEESAPEEGGEEPSSQPEQESAGPEIDWPTVDFESLRVINQYVVGWLYCEDTVINYPVAQCKNNKYFLHYRFDGVEHKAGCLFVDASNHGDFKDPNTIIYGHHMKNGSMFGTLTNYKKQDYYDEHPTLLFLTPKRNYVLRLFAGYVCAADGEAWRLDFADEADRAAWVEKAIDASTFDSGIVPTAQDRIMTLSTCSYEFDDARYVLLGILEPQD